MNWYTPFNILIVIMLFLIIIAVIISARQEEKFVKACNAKNGVMIKEVVVKGSSKLMCIARDSIIDIEE